MSSRSGLGLRLVKLLVIAAICGLATYGAARLLGDYVVDALITNTDFQERRTESRVASLQRYITRNNLSATDSAPLLAWCREQPLVLMEILRDGKLLFSSTYYDSEALFDKDVDALIYEWYSYYGITCSDGEAELLIICDEAYQCHVMAHALATLFGVCLTLVVFLKGVREIASYICDLNAEVQVMESGDLSHSFTVKGDDELATLAGGLESMRRSFLEQRHAETLSIQANQSLVSGLSHDLRTPLTKVMLYVEILRHGKYQGEDQLNTYLSRIADNIKQMELLSEDILTYSLSAADDLTASVEHVSMSEALGETLMEMCAYLQHQGHQIQGDVMLPADHILIYRPFVQRLFDNLSSNIDRYAKKDMPVRIELANDEKSLGIAIANTVDGASVEPQGTGIGLMNVKYMMLKMGGSCKVDQEEDTFRITLLFPRDSCS